MMKNLHIIILALLLSLQFAKSATYKWVDESGDKTFKYKKSGKFLTCNKECFLEYSDRDCNKCTVYRNWAVKCSKGKIAKSCLQECCKSGGGNNSGGAKELVVDLDPYDDPKFLSIKPFNGKKYICKKSCIRRKKGKKCSACSVGNDGNVYCTDGMLPSSCVNACCKVDNTNDPDPDPGLVTVPDYDPDDDDTLTTLHEGKFYMCEKKCMKKKEDGKCEHCVVYSDVVKCEEGRVHRGCRKACCVLVKNK